MPFCFSNNGLSFIGVDNDYVAQEGEAVFPNNHPTDAQLNEAFPLRAQLVATAALNDKVAALQTKLHNYVYNRYDQGTQMSFASLYASPSTAASVKTQIESAWTWVQNVLGHYYTLKEQIEAGGNPTSNFEQFDASDPGVKLKNFIKKK